MVDEWRRNGTCGACQHLQTDFGEHPTMYGHCKMYPRSGSRSSSDATCHEFKPLEGFAERIVLAHGDMIMTNGTEVLRRAYAWL
jgi:hypothetical protein